MSNPIEIPPIIYKYYRINEWFYDTFLTGKLFFSNAKDFNDPFDANVKLSFNSQEDDIKKFFESVKDPDGNSLDSTSINAGMSEWKKDPNSVYKKLQDGLIELANQKGICCFSKTKKDLLMWAHYADQHKGICIGFDVGELKRFFGVIGTIDYDDDFPQIDSISNVNNAFFTILSHKSTHWDYEQEVRILQKEKGAFPFPRESVKEIIFGLNTPENKILSVMELFQSPTYKNFKALKVFLHQTSYKLEFGTIGYEKVPIKGADTKK